MYYIYIIYYLFYTMASLTSNDTIEPLQARVAERTALLTANDIAVPESKGASASESKTDSSAAGSAVPVLPKVL